ncbi:fibronectin type III domain-containing protein [bacterium]|nr:fibronectin type III domain-containing protein [bacterium]
MKFLLSVVMLACCLAAPVWAAPEISKVGAAPVGDNWAQIQWTTDQNADSVVEYGLTKEYGGNKEDKNSYTGHRLTLFGLKPLTTYHYRVVSRNAAGEASTSKDFTFTTTAETWGAEVNVTGEPMGGGLGYSKMIKREQATAVVKNADEFFKALASAKPGDVVYVDDNSVIDISGRLKIVIPGGMTLASGRGQNGSVGGLIRFTEFKGLDNRNVFATGGPGIRITGVRFGGPSNAMGRVLPMYHLIYVGHYWTEIDNCEFWGWNYSAIETLAKAKVAGLYVHHNYFHHNTRLGCGYAVCPSEGVALVEGNLMDFHRHSVASSAWAPSSYEARYNLVMEHSISHAFDMHGAVDSEVRTNVGIWRFDEGKGATTKDSSTYGRNDPKMFGFSEACWVKGQSNTAIEFNGKSWIDCGGGYKNNLGDKAFSIMGWIRPEGVEGTQAIYSKAPETPTGDGYSLRLVGPALEATVYDATGAKISKKTGEIPAGKWTHVALTYNGSFARIYIDGKESASFMCRGVKQSPARRLVFGRDSEGATSFFKGAMDEVRAYKASVPAADVNRNFLGQGDIAGVEMRVHHNTTRILNEGAVCVRGKPALGCWVNNNWFYRANDDWNIRQINATGNFFIENNHFGPKAEKPAGNAPTLSWAGGKEFKDGGVVPEKGAAGDTYRFRVKYTDKDNDAPLTGYPRLVLKRKGEAFLYYTPLTMMPLDGKKFSEGRTYMCELALPRGNDYTYSFEAMDMAGNPATGEATQDAKGPAISGGNAVPVLYPVMGHPKYVENWVYPSSGTVDTEYDFRVTYLDIDNDAPEGGAPKVRITTNGADIPGSPFPMKPITQAQDANGRQYQLLTKLPEGKYECVLVAKDSQGAEAVNVRPATVTVSARGAKAERTSLTPFD